jgi:uncharacterized membrane protein
LKKIERPIWVRIKAAVRANLLAGLIVLVPVTATVYAIILFTEIVDRSLLLLPVALRPNELIGYDIPGLGLFVVLMVLYGAGLFVRNLLGRKLINLGERIMSYIPFVNPFYKAVKQLIETIIGGSGRDFKRVVLIEYPRKGIYALAYVTGTATGEIQERTEEKVINLFLPTTPNPTSGFYLMVPESDVISLDMKVEESFKVLISGGIINPEDKQKKGEKE